MSDAYIPGSGLRGKLGRFRARAVARRTAPVRLARGVVSFSFDDFPKTAVDVGAAEMERVGARATYYASAGFAGGQTHHGAMFDGGDIVRLEEAGHEIADHTFSHLDCARAAPEDVLADSERNVTALRKLGCTGPMRSFAFPYGEAAPSSKRALAPRYDTLRGVRPAVIGESADLNLLPAHSLDGGEAGLNRVLAALEEAQRRRGWLLVFAHDVQDEPTPWGCTPAMLRTALEAARRLDLDILTMDAAAERVLRTN